MNGLDRFIWVRVLSWICASLLVLASMDAVAVDCVKTGSVCVAPAETRDISGASVYRDCWEYEDTYECVDPNSRDYCSAISKTPGCEVSNIQCLSVDGNGVCQYFEKTYTCGTAVGPRSVYDLNHSHTVKTTDDSWPVCGAPEDNRTCESSGSDQVCMISAPTDYCSALVSAGCRRISETCTRTEAGLCVEYSNQYFCAEGQDVPPSIVKVLDSSYTLITSDRDLSACQNYEDVSHCTLASETCLEPAETRIIDGHEVYQACWLWQRDYTCTADTTVSDCDEYLTNDACEQIGSQCIKYKDDGVTCEVLERDFKCAQGTTETTSVTDCGTQSFCLDGTCMDTSYPPDSDFGVVVAGMEAVRQAGQSDLFVGEHHECSKKLGGLGNCCKSNNAGATSSNSGLADQIATQGLKIGAETVRYLGSPYVFDSLMNSGVGPLQTWAYESLMGNGALSTNWSTSYWGVSLTYDSVTGTFVVGFDPASLVVAVVVYVVMEYLACEDEDQVTGALRGQKLCHKVGSYCADDLLGACIKKKESYCCFTSKLARIIQEQGRPQLGKGWGEAESPDCSGFTVEQIGLLDFGAMDFSEFISDVMDNVSKNLSRKTDAYARQRALEKASEYYAH